MAVKSFFILMVRDIREDTDELVESLKEIGKVFGQLFRDLKNLF